MLFILISSLLVGCSNNQSIEYETKGQTDLYKKVIENFATENGLLKTDLKDRKTEYLAESQGLLLEYFLQQNMKKNFKIATEVIREQLLLKNNTISWQKIADEKSPTNALIDDLRIIQTLLIASEKWGDSDAKKLANQLIKGNKKHSVYDGYLINFSSENDKKRTDEINLSYINKSQYENFNFSEERLKKQLELLKNTPSSEKKFFPLKYKIKEKKYVYSKEVHMVDQLLAAINLVAIKPNDDEFYEQLKIRFNVEKKIFGVYDLKTATPTVNYESPAVYSYAIQLARLHNDADFEKQLQLCLNELKNQNKDSPFFGMFITEPSKETHVFDNLMPLLIEEGNR